MSSPFCTRARALQKPPRCPGKCDRTSLGSDSASPLSWGKTSGALFVKWSKAPARLAHPGSGREGTAAPLCALPLACPPSLLLAEGGPGHLCDQEECAWHGGHLSLCHCPCSKPTKINKCTPAALSVTGAGDCCDSQVSPAPPRKTGWVRLQGPGKAAQCGVAPGTGMQDAGQAGAARWL